MGFDIALVTKEEMMNEEGKSSRFHFLVDRGFCTFIMNAKNHPEPVIEEVEKALNLDLQFLLKPNHYDPKSFSVENLQEMGLTEEQIIETHSEPERGFVKIDSFLEKLQELDRKMSGNPDFEKKMNYDRKWWDSYFANDFKKDIAALIEFLENAKNKGQEEFSFKI
jgi:hypothetical protein